MARAKKARLLPRPRPAGCAFCGAPRPDGALPYEWDVHRWSSREHEGGFIMLLTCSSGCRGALDLTERKC